MTTNPNFGNFKPEDGGDPLYPTFPNPLLAPSREAAPDERIRRAPQHIAGQLVWVAVHETQPSQTPPDAELGQ